MGGTLGTALVTGASSGIGLDLCRLLARDGARLVMSAGNEERLRRAAGWIRQQSPTAEVLVVPADLGRAGAATALHARALDEAGPIDFLVNNAGIGSAGQFAEADLARALDIMQVNITSLVELTHPCLQGMLERRRGRILNVASMAGFLPGPLMAVYYASKAFVLSFSEALAEETGGTGVSVTALCPGPTTTGFQKRAGLPPTRSQSSRWVMASAPVAVAGYRGALLGRRIVIPGVANRLMIQTLRVLPRSTVTAAVRRAHRPIAEMKR
jgi:short-subunit dehydrogenase